MTEEQWSWPDVAREIRPLVEALTPDEALRIVKALFAEPLSKEQYLAARLAGLVRGYAERRESIADPDQEYWREIDGMKGN